MKLLIQRVSSAKVEVNQQTVGQINQGLLVYVGFNRQDKPELLPKAIDKLIHLRIFSNDEDKLDLSLQDIGGQLLLVSQFTLYANCQRGRRPDFIEAMPPAEACELYRLFVDACVKTLPNKVETGIFGADMQVSSINDGPLTFMLEFTN